VIVSFVHIDGIVDHHNFSFIVYAIEMSGIIYSKNEYANYIDLHQRILLEVTKHCIFASHSTYLY
jgi:hypothetical protein